jgi:DNA-binding MarR family transcriptional regulator
MTTRFVRCPHCNELLLTEQQKLVYDALKSLAAAGVEDVKLTQITKATGLSSASVARILERFEQVKLIDRTRARSKLAVADG